MATFVLNEKDGREKTALSSKYAQIWFHNRSKGTTIEIGLSNPPLTPARPNKPELVRAGEVPRRRPNTLNGQIAILHSIAHIELNAVDLHWDIIARFANIQMPVGFYDDWVKSAQEESNHFNLICDCLEELGSYYGDLTAHDGLWQAAIETRDDLLGRLAVVPMVLEARGLDVTPNMIRLFEKAKLKNAVKALKTIYEEEVSHVAYGSKWFNFLCGRNNLDPKIEFHRLVTKYFNGFLKPPFNEEKRADAGLPPDFYWPLADQLNINTSYK